MCVSLHVPMLSPRVKHNSVHHSPFHTWKQPTLPPTHPPFNLQTHHNSKTITSCQCYVYYPKNVRTSIYLATNITPYHPISPSPSDILHILPSPTGLAILVQHEKPIETRDRNTKRRENFEVPKVHMKGTN